MEVGYAALKQRSEGVAQAIAAERSARNFASRRKAVERADERAKTRDQLDKKRRDDRAADVARRRRIRVRVAQPDRPRYRGSTPRRLYHRQVQAMLAGTIGLSDSRGPDRLYSIHYAFTARGFASRKGRRWRSGEAERAALYGVREDALEGGERGWWSNIAEDRNELAAHYRASEALEKHDRANANVYCVEVIALPAELTARQRRRAVRRICRWFEARGMAYSVGIHLPDASGDQRNFHCHIVYSLRQSRRVAPYEWEFATGKQNDINTPDGIRARRLAVVRAINATLHAAGINKRYTHLSNKARNMLPPEQGKVGQQATWTRRRLEAMTRRQGRLEALAGIVANLRDAAVDGAARVEAARIKTIRKVETMGRATAIWSEGSGIDDMRPRLAVALTGMAERIVELPGDIDRVRTAVRRKVEVMAHRVGVWAEDGGVGDIGVLIARRLNTMREGIDQVRQHGHQARLGLRRDIGDRFGRISVATVVAGGGSAIQSQGHQADTRLRSVVDDIDHVRADGASRLADASRRIERARARDDIRVSLLGVTTYGQTRLAAAGTALGRRLEVIVGQLRHADNRIPAVRSDVRDRLRTIVAAIDPRSADGRRIVTRLYAAKMGRAEARSESAAMRMIRDHTAPPVPAREESVERRPEVASPSQPDAVPAITQAAETIGATSDRELARAAAVERERIDREAAWKRLVKSRAIVTYDGTSYDIDMAMLTDTERALLLRPGFADDLQRRLRDLFAEQTEPVSAEAETPAIGQDDIDMAIQHAFRDGGITRQ
ncbi:MAG: MobA/MobL family protein [Sphingomonas sp.]|uniref:MobA/MobL family protein n=1 Tax=Sphingomonas sp. TaxID=28214 RepID=UPI001AD52A9F|nr:MobA/MobL family protein [Sphingomonas sp.]MBN8807815.1 MobA/MobL family protein [Sphingomonas sp.]